jgi:predicted transcriptional regulator
MSEDKKIIRVRDVMKTDFHMIDGKATITEAIRIMKQHRTSMLFVSKFHKDDEYGVLNAGIIAKLVLAKDRAADRVNVYEINEKPMISVTPDMDIRYCSRLFARYGLMRAPVMENGEIIGVVSPIQLVLDGLCELSGIC